MQRYSDTADSGKPQIVAYDVKRCMSKSVARAGLTIGQTGQMPGAGWTSILNLLSEMFSTFRLSEMLFLS